VDQNSKFGDIFNLTEKKAKRLVQNCSPKSDPCTYFLFDVALLWQPHPTAAFYICVQTDSYLQWAQMDGLKVIWWPAY